jgi:hypothetical protein
MANVVPGTVRRISGRFIDCVAGATLTAGYAGYADTAASYKIKLADADAAVTAVLAGIILNDAADTEHVRLQTDGVVDLGVTLEAGMWYLLSPTAGQYMPMDDYDPVTHVGDFLSLVGRGNEDGYLELHLITNPDANV